MLQINFAIPSKPQRFAGHTLRWPIVNGKAYDFNGESMTGGRPLSNDALRAVHEAARLVGITPDLMYYRPGAVLDALEEAQEMRDDLRLNDPGQV